MRKFCEQISRLPAPRRRATVLILVVAILVILALMGTAFIAVARIDRSTMVLGGSGGAVDIETVVPNIDDTIISTIEKDLLNAAGTSYRSPGGTTASDYEHWDSYIANAPATDNDPWLGPRVPVFSPTIDPTASGTPGWPIWRSVSRILGYSVESPLNDPMFPTFQTSLASFDPATQFFAIGSTPPITYAAGVDPQQRTRVFPALRLYTGTTPGAAFVAGDADGDGIADSLLFRLPIAAPAGVTYYMALRVIDNNSAINASVAWKPDTLAGPLPGNFFPSNLDLRALLNPYDVAAPPYSQINELNLYRTSSASGPSPTPIDDTPAARVDFAFNTDVEALWMQLGRRLGNPGHNLDAVSGLPVKYAALAWADAGALAYKFCMINPATNSGTTLDPATTSNKTENLLRHTTYGAPDPTPGDNAWETPGAINYTTFKDNSFTRYPADGVLHWFLYNFNYGNSYDYNGVAVPGDDAGRKPLRPLFTTRNAVSNLVPMHDMSLLPATVKTNDPTNNPDLMPDAVALASPVPKANVNNATFGELWRAYWNVMCHHILSQQPEVPGKMFRNPVRIDPATGLPPMTLSPEQMLLLRSALAAINTIDLRDADDEPSTRAVDLGGGVTAQIFGTEKQPYIVDLHLVTGSGDVTLTVYNPYGTDIELGTYEFAEFDRTAVPPTLTPLPAAGGTIPSKGTLTVTLSATTVTGKELVLLRPLTGGGKAPVDLVDLRSTAAGNDYRYTRPYPGNMGGEWEFVYPGDPAPLPPAVPGDLSASVIVEDGGTTPTYPAPGFKIQLANDEWAGKFPAAAPPAVNQFPFGGFASNGDLLKVTFIGGYYLNTGGSLAELNSVTADSYLADDDDAGLDDAEEQLGRFCPIPVSAPTADYAWATDLFAYLTVQAPHNDFLPEVPTQGTPYLPSPMAVDQNADGTANDSPELSQGVEGLININTAPWMVLATVPWFAPGTDRIDGLGAVASNGTDDNIDLAKLIVLWRDGDEVTPANGPFRTIFDLYRVPAFQTAQTMALTPWVVATAYTVGQTVAQSGGVYVCLTAHLSVDFAADAANWSALDAADNITDFEESFFLLSRVSNLITVRSDSFTCYVLVQAWQDAGTPQPLLLAERRSAFIMDRTGMTSVTNKPRNVLTVPAN